MATAKAQLNNYRQSPRKVRLVAGLVRGKPVKRAEAMLKFAGKAAAVPVLKLIKSAEANAKANGMNAENLVVSKITVDAGKTLFRGRPMSRGRAFRIRKRTSQIFVELSDAPKVGSAVAKSVAAAKSDKSK